ncbi:MAG: hypothetical protein FWE85_03460 [Clostridiales bacterium]|nr:hypothetical protein [Clostridiales bacterium]
MMKMEFQAVLLEVEKKTTQKGDAYQNLYFADGRGVFTCRKPGHGFNGEVLKVYSVSINQKMESWEGKPYLKNDILSVIAV